MTSSLKFADFDIDSRNKLASAMINMIPHWYRCEEFGARNWFDCAGAKVPYGSRTPPTPALKMLKDYMQDNLEKWDLLISGASLLGTVETVQERIVIRWLEYWYEHVQWLPLLDYLRSAAHRTYENQPVTLNLILSEGTGSENVTADKHQKLLDPLSTSPHALFRISNRLSFLGYEEVSPWPEEQHSAVLCPSFLLPIVSRLTDGEISVHQTSRGDLLIMNRLGLLASRRRGHWTVYEPQNLSRAFSLTLEDFQHGASKLGKNLLQLALNLSYRRHGALLVFDPQHNILDSHLTNTESNLISKSHRVNIYSLVGGAVRAIEMEDGGFANRGSVRTLELASMDGALIFDELSILAFGAMIESHRSAGAHAGARTTAAYSARKWGGLPIKVSADGDISILFSERRSHSGRELTVEHELSFL